MMALEEGSGTEDSDNNLLKAIQCDEIPQDSIRLTMCISAFHDMLQLITFNYKYMYFVLELF